MNVYVGNLPSDVTGDELREVFEPFGRVETAHVMKQRHGGGSGSFGLVDTLGEVLDLEEDFIAVTLYGHDTDVRKALRCGRPYRPDGSGGRKVVRGSSPGRNFR
jgi:RNA recognition motif-containing protein